MITRFLPRSRAQRTCLIGSAAIVLGFLLSERGIESAVRPKGPPLFVYHGVRVQRDGQWVEDEDLGILRPGDVAIWQSWTDVSPDVLLAVDFDLSCGVHQFGGQDYRTSPTRPRPAGWLTTKYDLPADLPDGECEISRQGDFRAQDGRTLRAVFPPMRLTIRSAKP